MIIKKKRLIKSAVSDRGRTDYVWMDIGAGEGSTFFDI